ncbi:restriction endonuclease subunit S [Ammoniphilus resinae]|uniref:Type I restriction enzyme S subunit n=1 Tax=Ammoniphilus resinae TaxID=861532 RepID=A0ABS4GPV4_9BACL|nr:restriction endonuclease subunit S [Ammoniphilus resinae]MBP1932300.1 type I restriction enzyme S subunit [Ammoniphilus resinae]
MNAPKLRFKDFNDEWKMTLLSNLMSFSNGINSDKDNYGHGRKFINVLDILNNNSIRYDDIIGSVSVSQKVQDSNKVEYGDLLFLRSSETREDVGKSSVYLDKNDFALFGGFVIRGKKQGEYHPYFLKLNLESPRIRHQIGSKAGGSTRFNVSQSILSSIEVSMASQNEQQKIAEFMDHFDQKTKLQQEKIELLKEQKKGYMKKVFSQELRFKDANEQDYPEWKKIKLGKLTKKTGKKNSEGIKYQVAAISNKKGFTLEGERNYSNADVDIKEYKLVHKDEFAYNPARINVGSFGFQNVADIAIVSSLYVIFRTLPTLSNAYLKAYMHSGYFNRDVIKNTEGSVREYLFYENFSNIKIPFPCLEEQEKIATFLLKLDSKIQLEEQKLESLQEQKNWFMQQMFI